MNARFSCSAAFETSRQQTRHRCRAFARKALICSASIAALIQPANAQVKIWDGDDGVNFNWSNAVNWNENTAPSAFNALVFDGAAGLTNNNDFTVETSIFTGLTFNSTAGAFILNGNALTLNGSLIDNSAAATQTINLDLTFQGSTIKVADGGTLSIGGILSGAGGFTKTGGGTLLLRNANNTIFGNVAVTGGLLSLGTTGALGTLTSLTLSNAEFAMAGGSTAARAQTVSSLMNTGRGTITVLADPT